MRVADTYVRARIDSKTKKKAVRVLSRMGISVSDAIRLLLEDVIEKKRLPFDVETGKKTIE